MNNRQYTNYGIIKKMIGPIDPQGSTHIDNDRYDNLEEAIEVADMLLRDIGYVARMNADRQEYSMQKAGKRAQEFLECLREGLTDE